MTKEQLIQELAEIVNKHSLDTLCNDYDYEIAETMLDYLEDIYSVVIK